MVEDKKKDLEEIRKRLRGMKKKSEEIKMIIPMEPGENIKRNFDKILKILDRMLKEEQK